MMKLYDFAMALIDPNQRVILKDKTSYRICFDGKAEQLLDYSGIDYRKVADIKVDNGVLHLYIK